MILTTWTYCAMTGETKRIKKGHKLTGNEPSLADREWGIAAYRRFSQIKRFGPGTHATIAVF